MRVRKATVAGVGVNPATLAILDLQLGTGEVPYELELSLADLRPDFFRTYVEWLADMREFPDPDDEVEAQLRALRWPSLGVLIEVEPELFALVLLLLGKEILADLEHGRDAMVQVQYVPRSVDEVELRGRRIVLRGSAFVLPHRLGLTRLGGRALS
jgi:hypothetical protein